MQQGFVSVDAQSKAETRAHACPSRALADRYWISIAIKFAASTAHIIGSALTTTPFTSRRDVMGTLVNHRLTTGAAVLVAFVITALNVFLLAATFFA